MYDLGWTAVRQPPHCLFKKIYGSKVLEVKTIQATLQSLLYRDAYICTCFQQVMNPDVLQNLISQIRTLSVQRNQLKTLFYI